MKLEFPESVPGIHPPTAALKRILQLKGVTNPINNQPYSEALLFGIGGGIGVGYILYNFKHLPKPILVLGFRKQWNESHAFLEDLAQRLFFQVDFRAFDSVEEAQTNLKLCLQQGHPAIVWVDKAHLPYHQLPANQKGFINYQVSVLGFDEQKAHFSLDDCSSQRFEIREKTLSIARSHISPQNFLMMVFFQAGSLTPQEIRGSIITGIRECAAQLNQTRANMGISILSTWANHLIDQQSQVGWPQLFQDPKDTYPSLRTIYETIKLNGSDGFALRKIYADFLQEAAGLLSNYGLNAVAGQYLQLANRWSNLAESALPSSIPVFDRVKNLINEKYDCYRKHDFVSHQIISGKLSSVEKKINNNFPLDSQGLAELFSRLSSQIKLITELEISAAHRLREVTY